MEIEILVKPADEVTRRFFASTRKSIPVYRAMSHVPLRTICSMWCEHFGVDIMKAVFKDDSGAVIKLDSRFCDLEFSRGEQVTLSVELPYSAESMPDPAA